MATVSRQQLTDCISPHELKNKQRSEEFNQSYLWLWGGIVTNDIINVTPALKKQLTAMFHGWPETAKAIEALIGA